MIKETAGDAHCELTAALMDDGAVSVTLVAVESKYADTCFQASEGIAKLVNNPPPELVNSILRPVAVGAHPVKPKRRSIRSRRDLNPFNPMDGVQDVINSVNSGATNVATSTYNGAWKKVSAGSDQLEATSGASLPAALALMIVAAVATSLLLAA